MPTYTTSGIIYARATDANLAVARSASGGTDEQITDRIDPPTLSTGKITASTASNIVSGVGTDFENDFQAGQYLFAYGAGAAPVLVGRIDSVDTPTQITLTANAASDADNAPCGQMRMLIKNNESILIRIPRIPVNSNQSWIPNWKMFRLPQYTDYDYNNSNVASITQYSETGVPIVIGAGVNIPFTVKPQNKFVTFTSSTDVFCWRSPQDFPNFLFALYNPYGDSASNNLAAGTMFKLFTNETIEGLLISPNYSTNNLYAAGYSVPRFIDTTVSTNTSSTNTSSNN